MKNPKTYIVLGIVAVIVVGALIGSQKVQKTSATEEAGLHEIRTMIIPHDVEGAYDQIAIQSKKYPHRKDLALKDGTKITVYWNDGENPDFDNIVKDQEQQREGLRQLEEGYKPDEAFKSTAIQEIKAVFPDSSNITYKMSLKDVSLFSDDKGYDYIIDKNTGEIAGKAVGSDKQFEITHANLKNRDKSWKVNMSIGEAEGIAMDFVRKNVGNPEELMKEYPYQKTEAKFNTYMFTWGDIKCESQDPEKVCRGIMTVVIPTNGEILLYSNSLK